MVLRLRWMHKSALPPMCYCQCFDLCTLKGVAEIRPTLHLHLQTRIRTKTLSSPSLVTSKHRKAAQISTKLLRHRSWSQLL